MATSPKTESEKAPAEAVKETEVQEDDPTFPTATCISQAYEMVGEAPHIVAGALEGVSKKNLTVAEVKAAVKKWEGTEVV